MKDEYLSTITRHMTSLGGVKRYQAYVLSTSKNIYVRTQRNLKSMNSIQVNHLDDPFRLAMYYIIKAKAFNNIGELQCEISPPRVVEKISY